MAECKFQSITTFTLKLTEVEMECLRTIFINATEFIPEGKRYEYIISDILESIENAEVD